ncbi:MAG: DEAD/DEAH box helicase family protein [Crocinitomicaceae bacterium]|nr:DEAD/DEAH box helicase family protein [Crocinitomicaceae bacterium]
MSAVLYDMAHYNKFSQKLFGYQVEACNKIYSYYKAYNQGTTDSVFLVKMPTGTGKTGVMTVCAFSRKNIKSTLVIVPSKALRKQVIKNFKGKFWQVIDVNPNTLTRKIIDVYPSKIKSALAQLGTEDKVVFVTTIHSIYEIYNDPRRKREFDKIKELAELVIFDEGHREPSISWRNAVRNLSKPTVLFSATPYRNDLKSFVIDERDNDRTFWLKHETALSDKIIRNVSFKVINSNKQDFLKKGIDFFKSKRSAFRSKNIQHPKLIIRCETEQTVRKVATTLNNDGEDVLGIHQNFNSQIDYLSKNVPEDLSAIEILVHQWKLVEGIDEPNCCALIIYDEFGNTRSLIQQIGRIIRTTDLSVLQDAFVIVRKDSEASKSWEDYLSSDEQQEIFSPNRIYERYVDNLPETPVYYEKQFRELIKNWATLDKDELLAKLSFKHSCQFLVKKSDFNLHKAFQGIQFELNEIKENKILAAHYSLKELCIVYVKFQNSPILKNDLFLEFSLAFVHVRTFSEHVFYYSSDNSSFEAIRLNTRFVNPLQLQALLNTAKRFSSISLKNTDTGDYSIRTRTISAFDLNNIAGDLTDYAYLLSNALGYIESTQDQTQRRYIGFTRGRITDEVAPKFTHNSYIKWIKKISDDIEEKMKSDFFLRYAQFVDEPGNTKPRNILIDIQEILGEVKATIHFDPAKSGFSLNKIDLNELCIAIRDNKFKWGIGEREYEIKIQYEEGAYKLSCKEFEQSFDYIKDGKKTDSLLGTINKLQRFRIVPTSQNIIYAHGAWIKPRRKSSQYLNILTTITKTDTLYTCTSEKGSETLITDGNNWHPNSLFGKITRKGLGDAILNPILDQYDYFVCDDNGAEIADFIGINKSTKKICLIHAKAAHQPRQVSASTFHVVCSQAIKNLGFFSPFYDKKPEKNISNWDSKWSIQDIGDANNIHGTTKNSTAIWTEIDELLRDPNTSKELIIMVGQALNKDLFSTKINKDNISDTRAIQLLYLLNSTWSQAAKFGAKMTILC